MNQRKYTHKPIIPGFPWDATVRVESTQPFFPEGTYRAEIRASINSPVLATLTTGNGGLERLDDQRLMVKITGSSTSAIKADTVYFDVVRTDTVEPIHTGLRIQVKVEKTITAPNAPV